jgi:hypothetical protein
MIHLLIILSISLAHANFDGLDTEALKAEKIAQTTRACCNFTSHPALDKLGLFQFVDPGNLGPHSYGQKQKDSMGLTYTCGGGFIDIAHLRDNADWTAHIFYHLPEWLGSGKTIDARREGGFKARRVFFPKMDKEKIATLSQEDLAKLAVSISFSFATLHEIVTGFNIPVSFPVTLVIYEKASSFSVEDQYSNLLGGLLGAEAVLSKDGYEEALAKELDRALKKLTPIGMQETVALHSTLENLWWQKDLLGRNRMVQKRNYAFEGDIFPVPVPGVKACEEKELMPISVPDKLSNNLSVNEYFELRGEANLRFRLQLKKHKLKVGSVITKKNFSTIVPVLEEEFERAFPGK